MKEYPVYKKFKSDGLEYIALFHSINYATIHKVIENKKNVDNIYVGNTLTLCERYFEAVSNDTK